MLSVEAIPAAVPLTRAALLPTVVPAALGGARTDWPHWPRIGLVAVGVVSTVDHRLRIRVSTALSWVLLW